MRFLRAVHRCESDEYYLEYVEVPLWAKVLSRAVDHVDGATGHVFCGEAGPDAWWYEPVREAFHLAFGFLLFLPDRHEAVLAEVLDPTPRQWAEAVGQLPELF